MAFSYQKDVAQYNKPATQGDRANQQEVIYTPTNFTVASGASAVAVKVGGFVWRDSTNPETQVTGGGTGAPLGFMERVQNYDNFNESVEGTLEIPAGSEVNVAVKGDFFVEADGSVSVGDTVYANNTTGAATFSSSGATDTGFKAFTAGASGDMVIITNR
jgi:hypothetical protein